MSKISKKCKEKGLKSMGDHEIFLKRIQKTLYYGKLPSTDRLSLPVTELASEIFSEPRSGRSLDRLHCKDAASISRQACVSPCSFVLAMLYLERLKACNPDYLQRVAPSELFLVSLMVSSKFLNDYGEEDEVFMDEWAASGGMTAKDLIDLERQFLTAIDWEVFVNNAMFWNKLTALESSIARKVGKNRGYFTYTELNALLSVIDINNLIQCLAAITAILAVTYTAGILTLLGSMFIVSSLPGNCLQHNEKSIVIDSNNTISTLELLSKELDIDLASEILSAANSQMFKKPLDAIDVLKTGILLASIQQGSNYDNNKSYHQNDNVENISWDWWTSSTMNWLSKSAKLIENFEFIPDFSKYTYHRYIDMSIAESKKYQVEDQLDKNSQTRIQDQLEHSWHKEWTDTLSKLFAYKPMSYFHNIKA